MSNPLEEEPPGLDAGQANQAIRVYVRAHGTRPWGAKERAELQKLYEVWRAAVRAGFGSAA
ncbi:hypothetical protein PJ985_13570 [Streptomyces sp. ACA25]|uniref:hypothetical protein n=1 Tax=Streptomyces sp. ACA25 TaxID=3022596 RepID=UPI00230762AB|nr:hypothetical protein [Streptomyces sp. ACA25]MDB1088596.1 hypothetical protein [Streptomyces sp. ACA25]